MSGVADLFEAIGVPAPAGRRRIPSPLDRHDLLGRDLGIELWIKREDLVDDAGAGHKARKAAYVAADALAAGATVLVTVVSAPSGQAVAVAAAAVRCGMRAHLVYCGDRQWRPETLRGNYLLSALLGATVTWRERAAWNGWPEYLREAAGAERAAGEMPYLVPPGLSAWPGLLGSVELGFELAGQLAPGSGDLHVVGVAGSGGSLTGMSIGLRAAGVRARTHGVCVGAPAEQLTAGLGELRAQAASRLPRAWVEEAGVELYDGARGAGYDTPGLDELDALALGVRRYGMLLDPTYMAKAFVGLRQLVQTGRIPQRSRVVLVHSGGTALLLGGGDAVDAWARVHVPGFLGSV